MRRLLLGLLGVAWLLVPTAGWAALRAITPTAAGAVTTSPWIATADTITVTTLTNGASDWRTVHVQIFDEEWRAINFFCQLSPMETTYFIFEEDLPGEPLVTFECSSLVGGTTTIIEMCCPSRDEESDPDAAGLRCARIRGHPRSGRSEREHVATTLERPDQRVRRDRLYPGCSFFSECLAHRAART